MLSAYFDESDQRSLGVFAVGGYVFDTEHLEEFEENWQNVLIRYKLSRWHASEWESGYGPYRGWPNTLRHDAFNELCQIIRTSTVGAISVGF